MAVINQKRKEIQVKIVYYGTGEGGKTTNLEYISHNYHDRLKTDMISIKTDGDRTLFFDFLPFRMGFVGDYDIGVQLYTVPGQPKYNSTRKLVLKGVDGIVFVADSVAARRAENIAALKNLDENLKALSRHIFDFPVVMQYNKRDLADEGFPLMSVERMDRDLNRQLKAPCFAASALKGDNVVATLKKIITLTMGALKKEIM